MSWRQHQTGRPIGHVVLRRSGGTSRSRRTSTTIGPDGKRHVKTTTTIRHADGRVETETKETVQDAPQGRLGGQQQTQLSFGGGFGGGW